MNLLGLIGGESVSLSSYILSLSGLVAYYPLNESTGNAINNAPATIGTNDGVVSGATQNQSGFRGSAYSFDGSNDRITVTDSDTLDTPNGISIGFLLFANNPSGSNGIMQKGSNVVTAGHWDIPFNPGINFRFANANHLFGGYNIPTQTWEHYMITYDPTGGTGNVKLYVNGVKKTDVTDASGLPATTQDLIIGESVNQTFDLNGKLQHITLFNRAITQAEALRIAQLFGLSN